MEREVFGVDSGTITVAHELKAPLSLMRQLALSIELEQDKEKISYTADRIVATSERALKQVNDLVKVARLSDGLFEMEPVNPRRICDEVVSELWELFRFNRREVISEYRNREKLVVANHDLLYSVIYNFCLNAMNYSGEETPSEIFINNTKNGIRISVRDYGPCIPTSIWREIRQYGASRPLSTAMRPGSSGLGLYIASRFIEFMNGRFGLIRHRDGTSFFVDLPISKQLSFI
ncbi:MAG: HAMP domain-containing histidine kinase [Candidatus Nomurabacteria bacterium]|jgi:signal transduction histidine kinase|nr:HAMP domain-containing histidine kinase [Candidatus Nomurabacteria bacterium]